MTETPGGHDAACESFRATALHRRRLLQGALLGGLATTSVFGDVVRQASFAAAGTGNVLVVLSLRGGIDGLGVVVPHGDPNYARARPRIAVPTSSLLARDDFFGLHPALSPLLPLWRGGRMAAVQAVGMRVPNRSHFDAMEAVEDADPRSAERTGWVNRMVGLGGTDTVTQAVHVSSSITPTMLVGPHPVLATNGLDRLRVAGADGTRAAARHRSLSTAWAAGDDALSVAARAAVSTSRNYASTLGGAYSPANGASYPTGFPAGDLGDALKDTAHLIKAGVGAEVITVDYGSWDLHAGYGSASSGHMRDLLAGLGRGLSAFFTDLGTLGDRVTVVTISEFGRRVAENGNSGLDHGWGNMMLLLGGGVRGGYHGRWPWLGPDKLVDGDLAVTTDYRDVLGEVITRRFGRSIAEVFPGLSYRPIGVMT